MQIKQHIPNAITSGNLFCGCLAIVQVAQGNLIWAAYLVGIAAILDFFDGFAARLLKVQSPIGKDLDSLADVVTFGVVPGMVIFHLFQMALTESLWPSPVTAEGTEQILNRFWPYVGFMVTVFSAIRLAKFNNDPRQTESFRGLPTPANGILICSLPVLLNYHADFVSCLLNPWLLTALSLLSSFLLVSDIPLFSLKFRGFGWEQNKLRYWYLSLSAGFLVAFQVLAIPLVIILYVLLSIVNNIFSNKEV